MSVPNTGGAGKGKIEVAGEAKSDSVSEPIAGEGSFDLV